MFHVTEYEFYRSKDKPDLYKYRYFETKAPSLHLVVKNWKSWSSWLTIEQIKKIVKERRKFSDLTKGLRQMKPGTRRNNRFVEEKKDRSLYLWNTPRQTISCRSRLASYFTVPLNASQVVNNMSSSFSGGDTIEWLSRLNQLLPQFKLDSEQLKEFETYKQQGQVIEFLKSKCQKNLQLFADENRLKGEVLYNQKQVTSTDNDVYSVENYFVDLRNTTCSCENFQNTLKFFQLACKHIYASLLYREKRQND